MPYTAIPPIGPVAIGHSLRGRGRTTTVAVIGALVAAALLTAVALLTLERLGDGGSVPAGTARLVVLALGISAGVLAALAVASVAAAGRRVTAESEALGERARAVAAGDLQAGFEEFHGGVMAPAARGVEEVVARLRSVSTGLTRAAEETTMMSSEITAGSEEMAAAAGEIATTASELSRRATEMSEAIQGLTAASGELGALSADLFGGARASVERNSMLRSLSNESREQLDRSVSSLALLASEAGESVQAVEALARESEDVRGFITLVRKLARQSKLLALNAAMEAARAGTQGEGFAIVAGEVRRLATMSSEGAERTSEIVDRVLSRVEQTRDWSVRTEQAVVGLRGVMTGGARSFAQFEGAVAEFDELAGSIERTAASLDAVARAISGQLGALSQGTEGFAAAMEQVAASSEQQSASTEEIAAAAATLHSTAERLSGLIGALRRAG
jgi:methyl-accepting chemotaxis protein